MVQHKCKVNGASKLLTSYARVASGSVASRSRVTCELLSSHMQTTHVIISSATIGLLYLYC